MYKWYRLLQCYPCSPWPPVYMYISSARTRLGCLVRRGHSPVVLRWGYDLALHLPANIHRGLHLVHLLARSSSGGCRSCRVIHMVHTTCAVARSIWPSYIAIEYCKRRADGSRKHVERKSLTLLAPQADYTPPTTQVVTKHGKLTICIFPVTCYITCGK